MKALFTFVLSLWLAMSVAANPLILLSGSPPAVGGAVTYIIDEDFEGAGLPAGWTNNAGSPEWDYTTTPLAGAESVRIPTGANAKLPAFDHGELWIKFQYRTEATPQDGNALLLIWDPTFAFQGYSVSIQNGSKVAVSNGAGEGAETSTAMSANTTYYVWIHIAKGTGSNSYLQAAFSTTNVHPGTGANVATVTNGIGTTNIGHMYLMPSNATGTIYDSFQVAAESFE